MTVILHEGFESDAGWTHDVKVFPVGVDPYDTEIGNIFTPKGWLFWFRHDPGTWDQPEAGYCWLVQDRHRIKEGNGAYKCFGFCRRIYAGLMRQVTVTPGNTLCLTAWAHAWSNHKLEGHESCCDDGRCSCGVGREVIAIAAEDVPDLNGEPWNDAIGNALFVVGIDPYGGEDPFSSRVVWGDAYAIYNGYARRLEAEVVAMNTTATVFLRCQTLWAFKHNDAYWDLIKLIQEVNEMRGDPRTQYPRTYVLLPPNAGKEWALAVIDATWASKRYTLGGSADDAGIGNLDARSVIAVNPANWPGDLEAFFTENYDGIEYLPVEAATPAVLKQKLEAGDPK